MHGAMGDGSQIIFIHIPKTAGATFVSIARRQIPPAAVLDLPGSLAEARAALAQCPEAARHGLRFLHGHVPFGLHTSLPGASRYVTFLRHPVERMVSAYYYAIRRPEWRAYHDIHRRRLSLEAFVDSDVAADLNNGQTRFLAGSDAPVTGRAALEQGLHTLHAEVAFVGLTERFDESLLLCRRLLGWRRPFYRRHNLNRHRPALAAVPHRAVAVIERRNALDLELYAAAQRRFAEACAAAPALAEELHRFRVVNRIYDRVGRAAALIPDIARAGLAAVRQARRPRPDGGRER